MTGQGGTPRLTRQGPAPKVDIVHLGPGAFFRAFNGVFTHDAMAAGGGDWGILAVSLRSPTARDQLHPQRGVYTSVTLTEEGMQPRLIEAVTDVLVAPESPQTVVAAMADPQVKIVSLTITEKGYCRAASGGLDSNHPDIIHDLSHPDAPVSAIGFIVAALAARRQAGQGGFTVLSCDNLPSNGEVARDITLTFAREIDPDLATWIEEEVTFPSTMVDRITPATTDADRDALAKRLGVQDHGCVFHESFKQWVIEDRFVAGRPAWDRAGAQLVASVEAHEAMKLRCLNGTHSMLAYLGYLAGYETIADTVADPHFANLCQTVWQDEVIPTLTQPDGEDMQAYCASLMARYRETAIRHRTWQIAMDGSQKLPQRILGTIADNLAEGRMPRGLTLAVAAWMRYVGGVDEQGQPIDVRDPIADRLRAASDSAGTPEGKVQALLEISEVFPEDLAQNPDFQKAVTEAYKQLAKGGAQQTVANITT